jgi:hypothetical protein
MNTNHAMNAAVALLLSALGGEVVEGCSEPSCAACQPVFDLAA